jgi:hypothetical protein
MRDKVKRIFLFLVTMGAFAYYICNEGERFAMLPLLVIFIVDRVIDKWR